MKTRIWKKINKRIRIVQKENGIYEVQNNHFYILNKKYNDWRYLNEFHDFKNALKQKHYYILSIVLKNLGCKNSYHNRISNRKINKK